MAKLFEIFEARSQESLQVRFDDVNGKGVNIGKEGLAKQKNLSEILHSTVQSKYTHFISEEKFLAQTVENALKSSSQSIKSVETSIKNSEKHYSNSYNTSVMKAWEVELQRIAKLASEVNIAETNPGEKNKCN